MAFRHHLSGLSGCHAVFDPHGDLLFDLDDKARTQLDPLGEGPVADTAINEDHAHPRDPKDLQEAKEAWLSSIA